MKSNCLISFWPTIKLENDEWTAHLVVLYVNSSAFQLAGIFRISAQIRVKLGEFGTRIKQLAFWNHFNSFSSMCVLKKTIQVECTTGERTLIYPKRVHAIDLYEILTLTFPFFSLSFFLRSLCLFYCAR